MTFDEFLVEEYGQNWQGMHMDMVVDGATEDQISIHHSILMDEFDDYCEEKGIEKIPV